MNIDISIDRCDEDSRVLNKIDMTPTMKRKYMEKNMKSPQNLKYNNYLKIIKIK